MIIELAFMLPLGIEANPTVEEDIINDEQTKFDYGSTGLYATLRNDQPISQDPSPVVYFREFVIENDDFKHDVTYCNDEPFFAPEGTYDLYVDIWSTPPDAGDALVKAFCEIYGHGKGSEVILYETSFEDNFDNYCNWIQIDADCGMVGGRYDSFARSYVRASDGDHSFKTTMYDIYRGNQDDYLECTRDFDIRGQASVNVTFDVWVEGDYDYQFGYYWPFDYVDFEIYSHFYDEWINPNAGPVLFDVLNYPYLYALEGSYYLFNTTIPLYDSNATNNFLPIAREIGGGWWNIWCELSLADLASYGVDCSDFRFRFSWHTDPEYQYEGCYIDNVKVKSVEDVKTKVFQTQFQRSQTVEPLCNNWFKFPLQWTANGCENKEIAYEILLWLEAVDSVHHSLNNWGYFFLDGIFAVVGDWFDVELVDYDPPNEDYIWIETSVGADSVIDPADAGHQGYGVMEQGDDAHIMAQIHLGGTVPAENIPVTCTAYKKEWEIIYTDSFESMGWSDNIFWGTNPSGNLWHRTKTDAYTGDYSMGCFNKTTGHYENDMYYNCVLGPSIQMIDCEEMVMDYYTKYLTEWSGDYWIITLYDPATDSVLGQSLNSYPEGGLACPNYQGYGYSPHWKGPAELRSAYCSMSLKDAYDYWYDVRGMFRDGNGVQSFTFQPGFTFYQSDDYEYVNAQAETSGIDWSGLYIDDVTIKALRVDEKVWEQTVIVPGPLEPCDTADVQFEWEDVPFCNYLITVSSHPEGACGNLDNYEASAQILSVTDIEMANPWEVYSFDLSGSGGGEWGISSSEYEYYLATNADSLTYASNMNAVAQLCLDGEECNDISHLIGSGVTSLLMHFDAWWDLDADHDFVYLEVNDNCSCEFECDWQIVQDWTWYSMYDAGADDDGWVSVSIDLGPYVSGDEFCLRFRMESDSGYEFRGMKIRDLVIEDLLWDDDPADPHAYDFVEYFENLDNWCLKTVHFGQYWEFVDPEWCTTFPAVPVDDALVWDTEIADAYEAYLTFTHEYDFESYTGYEAKGYVELSADGGETWHVLGVYEGTDGPVQESFKLTYWAGNDILVRFRAVGLLEEGYTYDCGIDGGHWCVWDLLISGKEDTSAPNTEIQLQGQQAESGWFKTSVKATITATDVGAGMGWIHYILDGQETVVEGDVATFTISAQGEHNIEFWGVDKTGNEETPHNTVATFRIDQGSPPDVQITAPEPGLYLFGNKLLSLSKVFIIGAFTVEATAEDDESGVYKVTFELDGDVIAEDTEAPYSAYCALKHMGAGTLKVTAWDFSMNTAEDTLDVTYYKFL